MRWLMAALVLVPALAGCSTEDRTRTTDPPTSTSANVPLDVPVRAPTVAERSAGNAFAWDLHRELAKEPGNVFFSPQSIREAFGMLQEGARGQTATQIADVLNLPEDAAARQAMLATHRAWLSRPGSGVELAQANAAWVEKTFAMRPSYAKALSDAYGAQVRDADFRGDPEGERKAINDWVLERTRQRIPDLFPQGTIDQDTKVALVNAIYFNGSWSRPFDPNLTTPGQFDTGSRMVQASLMNDMSQYHYAERDGVQAVRIPYKRDNVSMLILLPPAGGLEALEAGLDDEAMDQWRKSLQPARILLAIPRFTFSTDYPDLKASMEALGIRDAFTAGADLSGIAGEPGDLLVTDVVHKAFIAVDERGTEAAAATGIGIGPTSAPPSFRADRPFLFVIQDDASGLVLFMGRLADPSK